MEVQVSLFDGEDYRTDRRGRKIVTAQERRIASVFG
jgi:hypothetical protein